MTVRMRAALIKMFAQHWALWEELQDAHAKSIALQVRQLIQDHGEPEDWEKVAHIARPKFNPNRGEAHAV